MAKEVIKRYASSFLPASHLASQMMTDLEHRLESEDIDINDDSKGLEQEIQTSEQKLIEIKNQRKEIQRRREDLQQKKYQLLNLKVEIEEKSNSLIYDRNTLRDQLDSLESHLHGDGILLQKFLQINPINDAFHIWYSGPFGTINNFRLGRLLSHPIDWIEINSALGEAASAIYTIAHKADYQFRKYQIYPMGCFARISRIDDRTNVYHLFTDGSFSLFPKRNFNLALVGFLTCIAELGNHVMEQDPTLQLPYDIDATEGKINLHPITISADEELWTRALKYLLSDVKWIIAWATKHLQHLN
jgi:beclin